MLINKIGLSEVNLYLYVFKQFYFIIQCFADYLSLSSVFISNCIVLEDYFHTTINNQERHTILSEFIILILLNSIFNIVCIVF